MMLQYLAVSMKEQRKSLEKIVIFGRCVLK